MAHVIKNAGKQVAVWELGKASDKELELVKENLILLHDNGEYELMSTESNSGKGQMTTAGNFFKVDGRGNPYPQEREEFLATHRHIDGDMWEQLPKPLLAWESSEAVTPEVQYLIDNKGLKLSPETPDQYFGATLWGAWLTAPIDAVLIFYSVTRAEDGSITDAAFNFVVRDEFDRTYHYC